MARKSTRRPGYATRSIRPTGRVERRINLPEPVKRPVRFQIRSLQKHEVIRPPDPWWFIVHNRGIPRPKIGEDPLEARAVPHFLMRGTILERILYRYLVETMHFVPGIDFSSQTSLQGGRIELGGIVADFLFPILRIVLNPIGPTHDQYYRIRKDQEQNMALEAMGYTVYMIDEEIIKDVYRFENYMRMVFGWGGNGGGGLDDINGSPPTDGFKVEALYKQALQLQSLVKGV